MSSLLPRFELQIKIFLSQEQKCYLQDIFFLNLNNNNKKQPITRISLSIGMNSATLLCLY